MKNQTRNKPAAGKFSLLRQICNFIPPHLVPKLARETGVENQWRAFTPWSHVVCLLYAQLTHSLGPLWQNWELRSLLEVYGTASGGGRFLGTPQQAYLAGFG